MLSLRDILDRMTDVFQQEIEHTRVLLLHPNSRYRSVFVAHLINSSQINTIYYALGPDDVNLPSFLAGITNEMAVRAPLSGSHVYALPAEERHGEELCRAFAQDLGDISSERFYLILDEYDRSDSADDVQTFIEQLISYLPQNCRLVINSRTLPRLPWVSMIARGDATIMEDDHVIRENFYGAVAADGDHLEIFALGPGFVLLNNQPIDTWEGHLPRLLFFFVLDRPVITRSDICHAFWPELDIEQAVNVFHVTKRRLHKALNMDVLIHEDGYYRINPHLNIDYDVTDFVTHLAQARNPANTHSIDDWRRASELYRGPFLQGHDDKWIVSRRRDFQQGYLEALTHMAQTCLDEQRPEQALALIRRAIQHDTSREDLHHQIMKLYQLLGRHVEAAMHYHGLLDQAEKSNIVVGDSIKRLYQEMVS